MAGWRCEGCGYINLTKDGSVRMPSRCPICGSRRLRLYDEDKPHQLDVGGYIKRIARLKAADADKSEAERRRLGEEGIHVLIEDEERGRLRDFLTREEATRYLKMIKEYGCGLAVLGGAVIVVENRSRLRHVVGVSASKLQELIEATQG